LWTFFVKIMMWRVKTIICVFLVMLTAGKVSLAGAWESNGQALGSLQSYSGILQIPTARVLPDWHMRVKTGHADPWTYYGGALGVFDRFEFHGQFTRTNTITAFPGYGYGDTKDRSAGMRAVLIKENPFFPQVAAGFYDATGNGFFSSRYITASKMFGTVDVTLGIGQGILAGEYPPAVANSGESFLTSDPFRKTRIFGGLEWHVSPDLTLAAEYSTFDWANMYGYRNSAGDKLKDDGSQFPVNLGFKYKVTDHIHATGAWMQGDELAGGIDFSFPLKPEGILAWKKTAPYEPLEKIRWEAYEQDNEGLADIVARQIKDQGFKNVSVACTDDAVWVEYENTLHLSDARSLGHVGTVCDRILPRRINTFYLNIKENITVLQSLKMSRGAFNAFMDSTLDKEGLLTFSEFDLYKDENWKTFQQETGPVTMAHAPESRFSYSIDPKIQTFMNNKTGFFKHKGFLRAKTGYRPWYGGLLQGEFQWVLFNEYDEIDYDPLEKENAVRTDLLDYEAASDFRVSMLALEQKINLPLSIQGRVAAGIFESAYAGFGTEIFRYFNDGRWGIGLEAEWVRKRDPADNFRLRDDPDKWYTPAFVNLYSQVVPSLGIEGGLKIGQFLAGDVGFQVSLRRSFKYFTIGGWYTRTDTDMFNSPKNRGSDQAGVYIRVPFSIFRANDRPGHFRYAITSFTLDPGALVRQPGSLYPMNPWSTTDYTRRTLDDMKTY
jgi:hypothetical protein